MDGTNLPFVQALFRDYAALTLPLLGAVAAEGKADASAVTRADREASALILARLRTHAPGQGVISEEEDAPHLPDAPWQWAVDPLDGTAAFARGLPVWGLGLGLLHEAVPVAGYMHFPAIGQSFTMEHGTALLNGQPMPGRPEPLLPDTRTIMITAIHGHVDVRGIAAEYRLHHLGSTLYHLAMLAAGRCEAVIAGPCSLWDIAPALPFTRAAGCTERYLDGSPLALEPMLSPDHGFPVKQPLLVGPEGLIGELLRALH